MKIAIHMQGIGLVTLMGSLATPGCVTQPVDDGGDSAQASESTNTGPGTGTASDASTSRDAGTSSDDPSEGSGLTTTGDSTEGGNEGTTEGAEGSTGSTSMATTAAEVSTGEPGMGAAPGELGGACESDADCQFAMGVCHLDAWGTPGGMCTVFCFEDGVDPLCPEGTTCGCSGASCACFLDCADDSECRTDESYVCCPADGCIPDSWGC